MIGSYFISNFMPLMILLALVAMMFVNREVKIPATRLFVACIFILLIITIIDDLDVATDVSGLSSEEAARVIWIHTLVSVLGYVLRPCVILMELLIILQEKKFKLLCILPAVFNAAVYGSALFGSRIAFYIDASNHWCSSGPLRTTIFFTQLLYLLILLYCSISSFSVGDRRKSVILVLMFVQAVLAALMEYHNYTIHTDSITALCILEYYIYLTIVYRQELNEKLDDHVKKIEEAGVKMKTLTKEVTEALANAIDAKDKYTHGHSSRVAVYSKKLAEMHGMSEEECDEVYYAALLHDVGKIGISEIIITKEGKLTEEEYNEIKRHPVLGAQILHSISEYPYLSIGASAHHERFDGKGYPYGLKGTDIPEIARIISVADAYDAMSSKRSYRDAIPQQMVREELVKGTGTQFDPEYARLMLHLIDVDTEYEMSEREEVRELAGRNEISVGRRRSKISEGLLITPLMTTIHLTVDALEDGQGKAPKPSIVVFDSLDGRTHESEKEIKDLNYFEYCEIWYDGSCAIAGARKTETKIIKAAAAEVEKDNEYKIEAVKRRDHALVRIIGKKQTAEVIIALPDGTRYVYVGLTGENCRLSDVSTDKAETEIPKNYIPRIAEAINYADGPAGDLPNVQIDGYRTDATEGVEIRDGLQISFHAKNLPTARLVWHCPFVDVFCSDDGKVNGKNYQDLAFMRFDGEFWETDPHCSVVLNVNKDESFEGWDAWKRFNQDGYEATVKFKVEGDKITIITENAGIALRNVAVITGVGRPIYAAITGDQVVITQIRISG